MLFGNVTCQTTQLIYKYAVDIFNIEQQQQHNNKDDDKNNSYKKNDWKKQQKFQAKKRITTNQHQYIHTQQRKLHKNLLSSNKFLSKMKLILKNINVCVCVCRRVWEKLDGKHKYKQLWCIDRWLCKSNKMYVWASECLYVCKVGGFKIQTHATCYLRSQQARQTNFASKLALPLHLPLVMLKRCLTNWRKVKIYKILGL